LSHGLFGCKRIASIKQGLATDDCKPKFRQTPKKQPEVKPYSSVIQGNCHVALSVQSLSCGSWNNENGHKDREVGLMKNRVVLITGALTGIGRATALAFAREGASIVVSGRHEEEGQKLVGELGKLGAEAEFVRSDVRHEDDVRSLVDKTVAQFGRLDVAVNNAGTEGKPGPVTEQSAESYAATFDTNVLGTLLSMKHELRVMLAQGSGSIINVSSTFGHTGGAGASVYVASKQRWKA
jgi:hypothetical protein